VSKGFQKEKVPELSYPYILIILMIVPVLNPTVLPGSMRAFQLCIGCSYSTGIVSLCADNAYKTGFENNVVVVI
jgi:hypothetical protein